MNEFFSLPILTFLIAFPLWGAVLCGVSRHSVAACRWIALLTSTAVLALAAILYGAPSRGTTWLLREDYPWIESLGIRFTLGMDGISLLMVLLTALLVVVAVLASWKTVRDKATLYFSLILVLEAGLMGVFLALDLFLFYVFWEIMLIPAIFLIIIWGAEGSLQAVFKFVFFTLCGSLLMLLSIVGLYYLHGEQTGTFSFAWEVLRVTQLSPSLEFWIYLGFLLAFAVKIPLVPLHIWLPDTYCKAPTAITILLAGVLAKTGVYGLYRFGFQLCPEAAAKSLTWLAVVALISVFYAAWTAFGQNDIKRLLAYSSISHLGLIVFGLTTWNRTAMEGSFIQMFNHGITLGALFAMTAMIEERTGDTNMEPLGGLWGRAPVWSFFFLVAALASLGLPGLNNFIGEILILAGAFNTQPLLGALAVPSILLTAAYMLRLVQKVLWGKSPAGLAWNEATAREVLILVPLLILIFWVGCYPQTFLAPLHDVMGLPFVEGVAAMKGGLP
jgi:NADH-quinone oxidoreductase subunit M